MNSTERSQTKPILTKAGTQQAEYTERYFITYSTLLIVTVSWERSSSNNFRVFTSAHWAGRWYQHHSHAQCMHIIHGLTLRLTVQADIQLWDKRRYLSSRKRGWGDNIPDKTEEKVRHRQTQRRKQKQEERQWDLHEKPKSWWETGAGESTLLLLSSLCPCFRACCILHGIGTEEF